MKRSNNKAGNAMRVKSTTLIGILFVVSIARHVSLTKHSVSIDQATRNIRSVPETNDRKTHAALSLLPIPDYISNERGSGGERENNPSSSNSSSRSGSGSGRTSTSSNILSAQQGTGSLSLPGADAHPILRMSDQQHRHTSVDQLMALYGEANGGGSCAGDFGNELVNRWRQTEKTACAAHSSSSSSIVPVTTGPQTLESSITCHLVKQTRHHGNGDNLCVMRNVAVDMAIFGRDSVTSPVVKHYVDTKHAAQPYIKFPNGFIQASCDIDKGQWIGGYMPGWNKDLTTDAVETIAASQQVDCAMWVDQKVLITERDTFANFFHDSEDFVNVFLAMAILKWSSEETQLYLTDLYPEGPFWDIWSRVYSSGPDKERHAALTAFDMKERFGHVEEGRKVCFKELAVGIYGPAAPITVASWDTPCSKTALVRAYADYVIRGLGHDVVMDTHYAQKKPLDFVTITYMARRPSAQWPERKYCDDEKSFFVCKLWDKFGQRALGRMIRNDDEFVENLKLLETNGVTDEKTGRHIKVKFNNVDYNVLSFEEQIRTDLKTDIMIGPHGAGLMHNIFMRDRGVLLELFVDGSSVNRHFHNLAFWSGHRYNGLNTGNPVNIQQLVRHIEATVKSIDLEKY